MKRGRDIQTGSHRGRGRAMKAGEVLIKEQRGGMITKRYSKCQEERRAKGKGTGGSMRSMRDGSREEGAR